MDHVATVTADLLVYETRTDNSSKEKAWRQRGWNVLGSVRGRTVFQRDYNRLLVFKFSTSEQVSDQEQNTLSS